MTIRRSLPSLAAALAAAASSTVLAADPVAPSASSPARVSSAEATKLRQDADRERLIAKLRAEAPKTTEKPKASALDLPIFNRYNRP